MKSLAPQVGLRGDVVFCIDCERCNRCFSLPLIAVVTFITPRNVELDSFEKYTWEEAPSN